MGDKWARVTVDILIATDLRFPGGNNASVVEEVRAQDRAGYTSALLHLPSPVQRSARGFAPRIRSLIDDDEVTLVINEPVTAKVLVIRHPTVLMDLPADLPRIDVEHVLIVANQVPVDGRARAPYYDIPACTTAAKAWTGKTPTWVPIGPQVRSALAPHADDIDLLDTDWVNIIDVDAWYTERTSFVSSPPTIGRHSRGDWSKWPGDAATLTAIYPVDGSYRVRILGGTQAPRETLGGLPPDWVDLPFNSVPPVQYLSEIDFLVYYHHPGLVEAFGRTVLEGLAAGAVAIVDPSFEATFGPACRYARPDEVREVLDELSSDWRAYQEQASRGVRYAREHFSYDSHARRIADIIGPPSSPRDPARPDDRAGAELVEIVVDPNGRFDQWHMFERPVIALIPVGAVLSAPQRVHVEHLPNVFMRDRSSASQYVGARLDGLLEVFPNAIVSDVEGALGRLGISRATHTLRPLTGPGGEVWVQERNAPRSPRDSRRRGARVLALLRQKAPLWFVNLASRIKKVPRRVHRRTIDLLAPHGAILITKGAFPSYPSARRARVLFVATATTPDPVASCRAIRQRAMASDAFSPALLAPVHWRDAAATYGIPFESLLCEEQVTECGGNWQNYRRSRIAESTGVFQPVAAVETDPDPHRLGTALDIAESLGHQRSVKESS